MSNTVNTTNKENKYVIKINFQHALTPQHFEILYDLMFARRYVGEKPSIQKLINNIAIQTRTRRTFTNNDDDDANLTDDSN